jgi:hypothetical protein
MRAPGGKVKWVARSKENHFLDCEAMQGAAQMILNLSKLRDGPPQRRPAAAAPPKPTSSEPSSRKPKRPGGGWLGKTGSIW